MSTFTNIEDLIKYRFEGLFLDVKAAQQQALQGEEPSLSVIEIEQNKTARSLLRVEKQAIREKDLNNKFDISYLNTITNQINIEVEKRLKVSIEDTEQLYTKILGLDKSLAKLLDLVGVKAATISKVEPIATELPWLFNDLMKFVNQPNYQRRDNKGKVVLVKTMGVGLNFFGLENLMVIIISLAFKRLMPQITDPYPDIKLRIWEEALTTAISCKKIASVVGVKQDHAFCLGMLQTMGKVVVSKLYFRLFESVLREALLDARRERATHHALQMLLRFVCI